MTSAHAWEVLDKGLSDANPEHRRQDLTAIASIGDTPQVIRLIGGALQDKDPVVRQTACAAFGQLKSPAAVPYLKQALNDTDEVAFTAAKALWDMGDQSGRGIFYDVLKGERSDAPGMVTTAMRDAKHKLRHPESLAKMGVMEASGALLGPASMGILVAQQMMKDSGASGRALAASYLADDPDQYAPVLLEWAPGDSNQFVRAAAARALGKRGNAATIPKLLPLLNDDHHAVRYMAAAAIVRLSGGH